MEIFGFHVETVKRRPWRNKLFICSGKMGGI